VRRRLVLGIALALAGLVSVGLAALTITYFVSVMPVVVRSPVEFAVGADSVAVIDNVNKTRASVNAKIIPLALWVSSDALRIRNVNDTVLEVRLRCLGVGDPQNVIRSVKLYLVFNATSEALAVELGNGGLIVKGESDWFGMGVGAEFGVKVETEGRDGAVEGAQAVLNLGVEVRPG